MTKSGTFLPKRTQLEFGGTLLFSMWPRIAQYVPNEEGRGFI
jgi:hypothetical protein